MHTDKTLIRRVAMMCLGVFLMGFSIALFVYASFGTDPYTCMNLGLSGKLGIPFGLWQLLANCAILVVTFFTARRLIGLGTIVNMAGVGFLIDFFRGIFSRILPGSPSLLFRAAAMLVAVVSLSFTAALYMYPRLGVSPYDSIAYILTERTRLGFRWCRILCDVTAVAIGFLCGSVVGVGTLVTAFFMGPLIKWSTDRLARYFPFEFDSPSEVDE